MNVGGGRRTVLVVAHTGRKESLRSARFVVTRLIGAGVAVRVLRPESASIGCMDAEEVPPGPGAAEGAEIVIVVGGDGTLLRAAELARPAGAPLLGVNLGHVGFLAEAEPDGLADTVDRVVARHYVVEERMTIDVMVRQDGAAVAGTWALNEATVEKSARERVLEVVTEVDGRPLSRWGCDGVVCATPTGSTAYAFSAGGPVVWPEVEALLMVPISAHALFARPMVVSPRSVLAVEIIGGTGRGPEQGGLPGLAEPAGADSPGAVMWCDGRRRVDLEPGARVEVRRGAIPVLLARLHGIGAEDGPQAGAAVGGAPFTDRLVAKFGLPVAGWRGGRLDGRPRLPEINSEAAWDDLAGDDLAGGPGPDSREETAGGHA
ncbi:MAG TPA: NAD kinase [Streptosporangiaceae bacterium]|nr:NAD kinase [Streptosporangiaceae bacterium]